MEDLHIFESSIPINLVKGLLKYFLYRNFYQLLLFLRNWKSALSEYQRDCIKINIKSIERHLYLQGKLNLSRQTEQTNKCASSSFISVVYCI